MKLPDDQIDQPSLARLGAETARLIKEGNYRELADRFGYALARGKDPSDVIQAEIQACLSKHWASAHLLASSPQDITVKYFAPNDAPFFALVECRLALAKDGGSILAELMVTTMGDGKHVFLEQISYAA
jgi:hypothetical protein